MKIKSLLFISALAVSAGFIAPITSALAQPVVEYRVGPPPPRYERIPPPRGGYVWAPGYWRWNGYRHEWARGHWERERVGYRYNAPRWEQGPNGAWHFREFRWER